MTWPIRFGPARATTPVDVPVVAVASARLPAAFDGFRIALAADLHLGHHVRAGYVGKLARLIASARPHLLVLGGDMLHRTVGDDHAPARLLRRLAGGRRSFAVLGNHEYAVGPDRCRRALADAGADVLVNAHRLLGPDGSPAPGGGPAVAVVGLDDYVWGRPDFPAAARGVPAGTFTVLLGHNPDLAEHVRGGPVDLMLAGHTHGGQVCPFGRPLVTYTREKRYARGLVDGPGFPIYVSRGLGTVKLPLRMGADPELPIVTLRRSP